MRRFLTHDQDSGELRLAFVDLWDGQHQRTEYRAIGDGGTPIRGRPELDGAQAHTQAGRGWYVVLGHSITATRYWFDTQDRAVVDTKTPCRRLASKNGRAKCSLCAADPTIQALPR